MTNLWVAIAPDGARRPPSSAVVVPPAPCAHDGPEVHHRQDQEHEQEEVAEAEYVKAQLAKISAPHWQEFLAAWG